MGVRQWLAALVGGIGRKRIRRLLAFGAGWIEKL